MTLHPPVSLCALALVLPLWGGDAPAPSTRAAWTDRGAEHLLNRAAFGASTDEVRFAVRLGRKATVERLLKGSWVNRPPLAAPSFHGGLVPPEELHARVELRRATYLSLQSDLAAPVSDWGNAWVENVLSGQDPLRDRMTLFWHGHFGVSFQLVGDPHEMLAHLELLRTHALGHVRPLLREMARDPAMLQFLDNKLNVKAHPNENWGRELLELFTLGDGNYTEDDVKNAAAAFTGWSVREHEFALRRIDHDFGPKTFLGVTGNLDGDDVIDIILEHPACARFLARKLLTWFEGTPPDEARLADYAAALRASDYDVGAFLRRLFLDPAFERPEVVGQRVASPLDFVLGSARRAGVAPTGEWVLAASTILGQRLFYPPSVKGWDEGLSWVSTGSVLQRSNVAGMLLGRFGLDEVLHDAELEEAGVRAMLVRPGETNQTRTSGFPMLSYLNARGAGPVWDGPSYLRTAAADLRSEATDDELAALLLRDLLAVEPAPGSVERIATLLAEERAREGLSPDELSLGGEPAERVLRAVAHVILSLPEAQLE